MNLMTPTTADMSTIEALFLAQMQELSRRAALQSFDRQCSEHGA